MARAMLIRKRIRQALKLSAATAAWVLSHAACSGSPSAPTAAPPLLTGNYAISLSAPDVVSKPDGQSFVGCPGAGAGGFSMIQANATVTPDGGVSLVRPATAADGTFEMELVRGSVVDQGGAAVSGSIRGVLVNTRYAYQFGGIPLDARATFSGLTSPTEAHVNGATVGASVLTSGTVSGIVTVGNLAGSSIRCATETVGWTLSRIAR